jgi:SagB-type dehydrogenase family enzyme
VKKSSRIVRRPRRYRRARPLVCHWTREGFSIANYATGLQTVGSPLTAEVLDFCGGWRTLGELSAHLPQFSRASLAAAVRILEQCTLLERSDAPRAVERAHEPWAPWDPAAGFFHFSTKDVPFGRDHELGEREFREHVKTHPMPPAVVRRRGAPFRALPAAGRTGEFREVLESRRTWRRFGRRPLDLQSLGTLLDLTFRIREWMTVEGQGRVPLKTSPSGGARHPLEAYVLSVDVRGLPRGLYHYRPDRHGLERLTRTATRKQIEDYLPSQYWYRGAAALVLITAVFERSRWRYDYPRGYRAVLIEAGHFCQTFLLAATWLGLAPFCSMALADSRIEGDLGVDGVNESVVYAAGVGTRPPGVARAQAPAPRRAGRGESS